MNDPNKPKKGITMKDLINLDGVEYIRKDSLTADTKADDRPITERIKSYEDACAALGMHPVELQVEVSGFGTDSNSIKAYGKLVIIVRALNEGWTPDWTNTDEYKYYPWFKYDNAGFGFSVTGCGHWYTYASVGSRLCFKTEALAEYAGKQFI